MTPLHTLLLVALASATKLQELYKLVQESNHQHGRFVRWAGMCWVLLF